MRTIAVVVGRPGQPFHPQFTVDVRETDRTRHADEVRLTGAGIELNFGRRVRQGDGVSVKSSGELEKLIAAPELFVSRVPRDSGVRARYVHWSFDEGSGRVVHARVGEGDRAVGAGRLIAENAKSRGPTWVEGVFGSALEFSGEGTPERVTRDGLGDAAGAGRHSEEKPYHC